ncbi:hypothetical protein [Treponema sp.]|uniref:hypothetical protein n=1 Tax=Treponema sp. TaxID=166 RepID=UPI003F0388B5
MKKSLVLGAVLSAAVICGTAFAQEGEADNGFSVTFSNELGSDVVNITEDDTTFAGMYNELTAEMYSERVDVGVRAKFYLTTDEDGKPEAISLRDEDDEIDFDWFAAFRPVDMITLGLSTDFFTAGSYLVIEDDNLSKGALGSDGFTVAFTGIEGLTLAATVPFGFDETNWIDEDITDDDGKTETRHFNIGFGAEYMFRDVISLGATFKDVCNSDDFTFGVYAGIFPVEGLSIFAGYTTEDDDGLCDVSGDNLVNVSVLYEADSFSLAADYLTSDKMFYAAAKAAVSVKEIVEVSATGTLNAFYDKDDAEEAEAPEQLWCIKPAITFFPNERNEICIEADFAFTNDDFDSICFPVYWKYYF